MHETNKSLFDKMHGEDQMAVDKLKEGIDGWWLFLFAGDLSLAVLFCMFGALQARLREHSEEKWHVLVLLLS